MAKKNLAKSEAVDKLKKGERLSSDIALQSNQIIHALWKIQ